jgi:hypothetical protein
MDWRAALLAGLIAGIIFLVLLMVIYPLVTGGSPWVLPRFIAAILLGQEVLTPLTTFDAGVTLVALLVHLVLSVIYTLLVAFIVHRWGVLVAVIVGALVGFAIYLINFFTFTTFFEWFYLARSWPFFIVHVLFGAVAGGVYELLEEDIYELDVVDSQVNSQE